MLSKICLVEFLEKGGASMMADELNLPVLSEISLLPEYSDNNDPAVLNNSQCEQSSLN